MKKSLFALAALATVFAFSCTKEQQFPDEQLGSKGITLTVSAENNITKGTYSDAGQFTWAAGDKIGVNAWMNTDLTDHWPAPLTLKSEDAGKTVGNFEDTAFDTSAKTYGTVAFYPWNGYAKGTDDENGTNVGDDGKLYVHLKPVIAYNNDSSNPQHLLPLAATITDNQTDPIQFKQLGAGIKVSIKNVPAKADKISLTIPGKNITGWYTIEDISKIATGEAYISSTDGSNSTVSITFSQGSSARDMDFVFPVPTGAIPGMEVRLYSNNVEIYKRVAPAQPTLTRGQLLTNDPLTIDGPYYLFGYINGADYACNADADNLGVYKFVNGKLLFISSGVDAYVAVKDPNNNWYMTEGYPGDAATSAVLKPTSQLTNPDKLKIPADTAVELSMTKSGDVITLSYTVIDKVSLFFFPKTMVQNQPCFACGNFSTGWPGWAINDTEAINGSLWYKIELDANTVWGKSYSVQFVDTDRWNTASGYTPDFSKYAKEYFFEVTQALPMTQLAGRPKTLAMPVMNGSYSDWTDFNEGYSGSDYLTSVKALSDGTNLYVYQRWDNTKCSHSKWNSYQFVYVDTNYDLSTGSTKDGSDYRTGSELYWEFYFYFDTADKYSLIDYCVWDGSSFASQSSTFAAGQVFYNTDGTDAYEIEYSIPLSSLGITAGSTTKLIRMSIYGYTYNQSSTSVSFKAPYFTVVIPSV